MPSSLSSRLFLIFGPLRRFMPVATPILAVLLMVTGPVAFMREAAQRGTPMKWDEGLYWTMSLFAVSPSPLGYPHQLYLRVLHFLAPALAASALIGAVIQILEERGPIFLSNFRRHAVIGGLGNLGATLARHLIKHRQQVVAIERQSDSPAVDEMRAAGASLVLVGDMTAVETLRRARGSYADRVFFVSRSDVANLDAAFQLRRLVELDGSRKDHPPAIFAHCFDSGLSDALGDRLANEGPRAARIITFNSYRFAAKALIGDLLRERLLPSLRLADGWCLRRTAWPELAGGALGVQAEPRGRQQAIEEDRRRLLAAFRVEREEGPELGHEAGALQPARFAVLGVGRFGRSVLRELLAVAPRRARFLIVDRSEAEARVALDQIGQSGQSGQGGQGEPLDAQDANRCEHFVGDATSSAVVARVAEFAPSAALICTDSDLGNLRLAMELRRRGIRAVTRMSGSDAAQLSRGLDEQGITVVNVARLFRAAIPILTHEQMLRACINLDVKRTEELDHLFYLAKATPAELKRLGPAAVALRDLPGASAMPEGAADRDLALIWHREVEGLPI